MVDDEMKEKNIKITSPWFEKVNDTSSIPHKAGPSGGFYFSWKMQTSHTRSPKEGVKRDARSQETPKLIPAIGRDQTLNLLLHMQMFYLLSHKHFLVKVIILPKRARMYKGNPH